MSTDLLDKIKAVLDGIEPAGDYGEACENAADGGNYDDAFESGVDMGYAMLADEIREIIDNE